MERQSSAWPAELSPATSFPWSSSSVAGGRVLLRCRGAPAPQAQILTAAPGPDDRSAGWALDDQECFLLHILGRGVVGSRRAATRTMTRPPTSCALKIEAGERFAASPPTPAMSHAVVFPPMRLRRQDDLGGPLSPRAQAPVYDGQWSSTAARSKTPLYLVSSSAARLRRQSRGRHLGLSTSRRAWPPGHDGHRAPPSASLALLAALCSCVLRAMATACHARTPAPAADRRRSTTWHGRLMGRAVDFPRCAAARGMAWKV